MDVISTNASLRRYERDFLLQLRLHPCSLQKPKSLKDHEIVKDKLYLHQMENCFVSNGNNLTNLRSACQAAIKADSEMMFRSHRTVPEGYSRTCPLYTTSYKAPWSKRSSYEDLWNSYNRTLQNNTPKDQSEAPVKCKKTLQIIDPSNGKNILEDIISSPRTSQESSEENGSDPKDNELSSGFGESANDKLEGSDGLEIPNNGCETQSVESTQEIWIKPPVPIDPDQTTQDLSKLTTLREVQCEENIAHGNGLDNCKKETSEASSATDLPSKEQMSDYEKYFSYNSCEDLAAANVKSTDNLKEKLSYNSHPLPYNNRNFSSRDCALRTEEQLKANIMMLKEKLYSMRQEQQKMVIYQSFLRYKKHQLDEIVRSLDDQKIEIANWECNLVSKEKRLKEREAWMEVKRKNLRSKEEELRRREEELREREGKLDALDDGNSVKYTNGIHDGKLNKIEFEAWKKGHNGLDAWNMAKDPEEFAVRKFAKYSDVVVGRKLATEQNGSGEFGDTQLAKDSIKLHYENLAKGLNEFDAWKLSKNSYKMDTDELDNDLKGAQIDEASNKDGTLHPKAVENAINCNGLKNFHENGVDYPEVNGEYPMDNMNFEFSKNAVKWSDVQ